MGGLLASLLLGACLAARPAWAPQADPTAEAERQAALATAAGATDLALERLQDALADAVDAGRRGSALIVSGDAPPGPFLLAAAATLEAAVGEPMAAGRAVTDLRGTLQAVRPGASLPSDDVATLDLASIAGQLRASADAAGPFVARRLAAEMTLTHLADALNALDGSDPMAALQALDEADDSLDEVAAWEEPPPSLPYWVETTGALLAAARAIADATVAGDPAAAAVAGEAYRLAAERASRADRALALAIAETGSGITVVPLRRLAEALATVAAQRAAVASVVHPSA